MQALSKNGGKTFPAVEEDFELDRYGIERNELNEKTCVFIKRRDFDQYCDKCFAARYIDRFFDDAFYNSHSLVPPSDYFEPVPVIAAKDSLQPNNA